MNPTHEHPQETLDETISRVRSLIDAILATEAPPDVRVRVDLDELERKLTVPRPAARPLPFIPWRA